MPRGQLTEKQVKFSELVASGVDELKAVLECGYTEKSMYQNLYKLRNNKRVQERIEFLNQEIKDNETASREDRETFWTKMMNDPENSGNVRLEASKLLGKAQGDFIDRKQINTEFSNKPIVVIPEISPEDWEKYWEDKNQ